MCSPPKEYFLWLSKLCNIILLQRKTMAQLIRLLRGRHHADLYLGCEEPLDAGLEWTQMVRKWG